MAAGDAAVGASAEGAVDYDSSRPTKRRRLTQNTETTQSTISAQSCIMIICIVSFFKKEKRSISKLSLFTLMEPR